MERNSLEAISSKRLILKPLRHFFFLISAQFSNNHRHNTTKKKGWLDLTLERCTLQDTQHEKSFLRSRKTHKYVNIHVHISSPSFYPTLCHMHPVLFLISRAHRKRHKHVRHTNWRNQFLFFTPWAVLFSGRGRGGKRGGGSRRDFKERTTKLLSPFLMYSTPFLPAT